MSLLIDALSKAEQARQRSDESRPTAARTSATTLQRDAARNTFAAKSPPQQRRVTRLALAIITITASGLLAYFWWQLPAVSDSQRPPPAVG